MTQAFGGPSARLTLPFWIWPLAVVAGLLISAASLAYAPSGRLNVLWLWWLWAGLPLMGAVVSLLLTLTRRERPWLFRWGKVRWHWFPNRTQRWQMLCRLHGLWLLVGIGMLAGFWLLLLFTDLAFGWSSTLLDRQHLPEGLFQTLSLPWATVWPSAVPDAALLEATRYLRIAPGDGSVHRAGDWWPFLMASLITYNLIPRAVLVLLSATVSWYYWRAEQHSSPAVTGPSSSFHRPTPQSPVLAADSSLWQSATVINWETPGPDGVTLGASVWRDDEHTLERLLVTQPERLLWRVSATRSPVGELADLVNQARERGVAEQGIQACHADSAVPERHLASWRHFASQQGLIWVSAA
ncbi:DUF2868 domain-containing protein [Marinimicrobium sp. ARAG 43.8]|uniref:DUF2868 domain-containing protein n=1 Tax=Marinimicrobium sp. ARAG 43.8 TaxID=3418719 RepID=UPI003CF59CE6